MKKGIRAVACLLTIAVSLGFVACETDIKDIVETRSHRFEIVTNPAAGVDASGVKLRSGEYIMVDTLTGVLYLSKHGQGSSGITVLVDAEGRPLTEGAKPAQEKSE